MKRNYLTPKQIRALNVDLSMSKEKASELCEQMKKGVFKYRRKLKLVKDIPLVATLGFSGVGLVNTIYDAINQFWGSGHTANAAIATVSLSASAGCLLLTALTFKKCDKKLKNLCQVTAPKYFKLQKMAGKIDIVEDEIQ